MTIPIAKLLNGPTTTNRPVARRHADKRMDMASLDLSTQQRKYRPELSLSRIIQELAVKEGLSNASITAEGVAYDKGGRQEARTLTKSTAKRKAKNHEEGDSSSLEENTTLGWRKPCNGFILPADLEKKAKQRTLVKQSYYRKLDTLAKLRNKMETLKNQCKEVIISRCQIQINASSEAQLEEEQRYEKLLNQYTKLAITQDGLRHANEKLRYEVMEQLKARTSIGILLNEELQEHEQARTKGVALGLSRLTLGEPCINPMPETMEMKPKPVLDFMPISEDDCIAIVKKAYTDVRAFADKQNYITTGASVFGWRDRRQVDGETMRFFLEKTFENYTAAEVSSRMWDLVSSEHGVNRIYASDVAINFHLVQRVNDENVLFYRTIEPTGMHMVLKALVLASRIQIDDNGSFMLLFRSVDPVARGIAMKDTTATSGLWTDKKEIWSEVFSWGAL
ncbi:unnamed protein product [Peronospora belbahrii]|uniref:Uncharacterized protein n=1 Tax=Peronospora belbahrii TaxID=622444 RepID=A0AAU9LEC8_9STRA|nr:unnamed protein product [Peronospora belbahrii]